MAGLGLVGAYGSAGARQSLEDLLQQRVLAAKQAQLERQQQIENARAERELAVKERRNPDEFFAASSDQDIYNRRTGGVVRTATPKRERPVAVSQGGSLVDPASGRVLTSIPKEDDFAKFKRQYDYQLAHPTAKVASELAEADTAKRTQTADIVNSADQTLSTVDQLLDPNGNLQPGVSTIVGFGGPAIGAMSRVVGGTRASDKQAALDRLSSRMIVDLIAQMKAQSKTGATGFGQLSEKEGAILGAAAARLQQSQTEASFQDALRDVRAQVQKIRQAATVGGPVPSHRTGGTAPPDGGQEFDWINGRLVPRQ